MDTGSLVLLIIAGIIFVAVIGFILKKITRVVPQEECLIIYRFGHFNRVGGPGPVQVIPGIEKIVRTIEIRNRPIEVTIKGIFAYGVPNNLTLNFWARFDPQQAAQGNRRKMAEFVQISERERREQIEVKVRDALIRQVATLQQNSPLPDKAKSTEKIAALAPGSPRYHTLIKNLAYDLEKSLPSIGIIFNTDHPIVMTDRGLTDEIIQAIGRRQGREIDSEWLTNYADEIRQRFPEMSNTTLAQILSSLEGVDAGKVQRLLLEKGAGDPEIEYEMSDGGEAGTNFITKPQTTARTNSKPLKVKKDTPLTKSDFAVLKRVPREASQRKSA